MFYHLGLSTTVAFWDSGPDCPLAFVTCWWGKSRAAVHVVRIPKHPSSRSYNIHKVHWCWLALAVLEDMAAPTNSHINRAAPDLRCDDPCLVRNKNGRFWNETIVTNSKNSCIPTKAKGMLFVICYIVCILSDILYPKPCKTWCQQQKRGGHNKGVRYPKVSSRSPVS